MFTSQSILSFLVSSIKKDVSVKTFLGRGSGETFQMEFDGEGFVVIQPYEEVYEIRDNKEALAFELFDVCVGQSTHSLKP